MNVKRLNVILQMLFEEMNALTNEGKELPVLWDVMHLYSSLQIAKILAMKRGLNSELAAIAAAFHDIGVVVTKKTNNHAQNAEKYIREIIRCYNENITNDHLQITKEEYEIIINAVLKHSEVETFSDDLYVELLKDVDSFDKYLHGIDTNEYCIIRSKKVIEELGLNSTV